MRHAWRGTGRYNPHRATLRSPAVARSRCSSPATMRYVAAREPGPPEVLDAGRTARCPRAEAGEVLIEVAYAGVNRPDCLQRAGTYPPPPDASPIIGLEVAGTVVARGRRRAPRWRSATTVCALTPGGGYAEYCTTPAAFCLPVPPALTLREAASLPETYFTVWNNLFDRGRLARRRDGADPRRHERHRPHRDPARARRSARPSITTAGSDGQGRVLPRDRRRPRDRLPDAGFRRRGRAHHRQARRRRRARHGRRRLHREQPEAAWRSKAGWCMIAFLQGEPRRGRLAPHHDEAPDRHRLDAAREPDRAQGGARAVAARQGVAALRAAAS